MCATSVQTISLQSGVMSVDTIVTDIVDHQQRRRREAVSESRRRRDALRACERSQRHGGRAGGEDRNSSWRSSCLANDATRLRSLFPLSSRSCFRHCILTNLFAWRDSIAALQFHTRLEPLSRRLCG